MAWTDKMVDDLRIMWKQGLTTGEIGKRLGVSKNSIVGKVHRLQLDARPSPIKKKDGAEERVEETVEKAVTPKAKVEKKTASAETKNPVTETKNETIGMFRPMAAKGTLNNDIKLTDLDNHTCRWPIGDPKDENFHFCGKKIRVGQTYCEEHSALAYVKPGKK